MARRKKKRRVILKSFDQSDPLIQGSVCKLDDSVLQGMTNLIEGGITFNCACDLMGIHRNTHYNWMKRGREFRESESLGEIPNMDDTVYAEYHMQVMRAFALYQQRLTERSFVPDYFTDTWIRDMTILERRNPEEWGKTTILADREEFYNPDDSFL